MEDRTGAHTHTPTTRGFKINRRFGDLWGCGTREKLLSEDPNGRSSHLSGKKQTPNREGDSGALQLQSWLFDLPRIGWIYTGAGTGWRT